MAKAPRISIVSVVHNLIAQGRADHFRQMVASVSRQSYENIEHIVVDGGSEDGTVGLIESCAEEAMFSHWISEPDKGIYDAMNKGARIAGGDYIGWLNSDDYYHDSNGIRKLAHALAAVNADYCYARMRYVNLDGTSQTCKKPKLNRCLHMMPFPHPSFFVRGSVFDALGGYDANLRSAADYGLVLKMLMHKNYRGVYVDCAYATFREGGASSDYQRDRKERASIYASLLAPFGVLSEEEWLASICRRRLPMRVLLRIVLSSGVSMLARRAALFEIRRAVRRKMKEKRS